MTFNIDKCHSLQVGSKNMEKGYEMSGVKIESVHSVKDLGVTVASDLRFSQQCNEYVKGKQYDGFDQENFSLKNKDAVLFFL